MPIVLFSCDKEFWIGSSGAEEPSVLDDFLLGNVYSD